MASSIFTTYIKTREIENFPIRRIIAELFDDAPTAPKNEENPSLQIFRHEKGIEIFNGTLSNELISNANENWVNRLFEFFNQPEIILAYHRCDTTSSCGYCLIENGKIIRRRYWRPSNKLESLIDSDEMGQPLQEELAILENLGDTAYNKKSTMHVAQVKEETVKFHFVNHEMVDVITRKYIGVDQKEFSTMPIEMAKFDINKQYIIGEHISDS